MPDRALPSPAARLALAARRREIDAVRLLAGRVELAEAIGTLIHALQRERGASTIYLASGGQRFSDVRLAMAEGARQAESSVRAMFDAYEAPGQGASARVLALMAWTLLGLDAMQDLRSRIERRTLSAHEEVAGFSAIIAGLVELIYHLADAAQVPGVSSLLVAFLHLVQGKEEAGQERAVGALLFASGQCSEAHQQRINHLIEAQERNLQVFCDFVDAPLREKWEAQQLLPGTARLERLRRTLCAARADAALDAQHSDAWFEVCSERIDMLWELELALARRLREACAEQVRQAEQDLHDSEAVLRHLRDRPPLHQHAVERYFDLASQPGAVPEVIDGSSGQSTSLLELVHSQSARLSSMESELDAARRALHERKVIERAKGVLMSRLRMTEEAAFRALQKTSMDQNRRLLDVAEATLALPDQAFQQLAQQGAAADAKPRSR
ncbi:nitrate- and nitrite sensing domain-containing protein [Variovorax dokdonensis]|uniref:Nitrate- and nitrite sensing domain-containing protein n=1 Tax=Variovorax dokdonensis TaxID=344883 RepID=A0ABT7NA04_9BURK|nr:nitrate- and nitrite sensing domain-containing protein [Variovorax dokdonensis]MDM0044748.1 nitrate- and nitrite sensing domain-containing protein [Variovorax dokdonensis]